MLDPVNPANNVASRYTTADATASSPQHTTRSTRSARHGSLQPKGGLSSAGRQSSDPRSKADHDEHHIHHHSPFTRTHAKHLAAKVVSDLYQCSLLYDSPGASSLTDYEAELVELLAGEYVEDYEFGFKKDGQRILSWRYSIGPDGGLHGDSNAGCSMPGRTSRAPRTTTFSRSARSGPDSQRLHGRPSTRPCPFDGRRLPSGRWRGLLADRPGYTAGGTLVARKTFRPW